jgi:hypothetical protein
MEIAMRTIMKALTIVTAAVLLSAATFSPATAHHDDAKGSGVVYEGAGGR